MQRLILLFLLALLITAGGWTLAMAEHEQPIDPAAQPRIAIKFVYLMCNDIDEMRAFYTDLIGLNETSYNNDEQWQWLCYECNTVEFMFFPAASELPVATEFATQPGWPGGTGDVTSWSVEVPGEQFAAKVQALIYAGVPTFASKPVWAQDSYWSFPVLDPMGNTVELYNLPAERPKVTECPD